MRRYIFLFFLVFALKLTAQVGVGTTEPLSTLDVNGSLSLNITTTTGDLTLNDTHYTVVLSGNHNITLPFASSCLGRVYVIKNPTVNAPTISSYNDLNGVLFNTIPSGTTMQLQSDGNNWHQIGSSKISYEKIVIWAEEAGDLASNTQEWSFANGDTGFIGIPLPESWEAYAVSFHADNTSNASNTMVMGVGNISENGSFSELLRFTASGDNDNLSYTEMLATPVNVPSGTTLGFRSITETGEINSARVAVWLRRIP